MAHAKRQATPAVAKTMDRAMAAPTASVNAVPDAAAPNLAALEAYDLPGLRAAWRRLHRGATPPSLSRDLLLRDTAFRLQEIAFGGLRPAIKRKLAALGRSAGAAADAGAGVDANTGARRGGACSGIDEVNPANVTTGAAADIGAAGRIDDEATGRSHDAAAPASDVTESRRHERSATRTVTIQLKPGATLVRAWHGKTHTVQVTPDGYEYDGHRYGSLSLIAQQITGSHWSGPRFFGLVQRTPSEPAAKSAAKPKPPALSGGSEHACEQSRARDQSRAQGRRYRCRQQQHPPP